MKNTKRILAILLNFALALGLAAPVMAAVNWNEFYIVTQPQDLYVPNGEGFTLNVEMNIPDWVDEIAYQWYNFNGMVPIEGATADTLLINPGDPDYPRSSRSFFSGYGGSHVGHYICRITAYTEESGTQSRTHSTLHATVTAEGTF